MFMVSISVLRLGHRIIRDKRVSTHVALVARAFGASSIYYSGQKDSSLEDSVNRSTVEWGGPFKIEHTDNWRRLIKEFKGTKIHLTMYGLPFKKKLGIFKELDLLIILGGQKVPWEVYEMADYNLAVTNQPHSEIAALAVFLDNYYKGEELEKKFENAHKRIEPHTLGKEVIE